LWAILEIALGVVLATPFGRVVNTDAGAVADAGVSTAFVVGIEVAIKFVSAIALRTAFGSESSTSGAEVCAAGCAGTVPGFDAISVSEFESVSGSGTASEFCTSTGIATGEEIPSVVGSRLEEVLGATFGAATVIEMAFWVSGAAVGAAVWVAIGGTLNVAWGATLEIVLWTASGAGCCISVAAMGEVI
jgi:hypothetical protein